jgi:outer membrane immunogenic protein
MKKLLLATTAIVALACGSARAADFPVYKAPPPVAPAWTWTGFYIGGHAGYGWGHESASEELFGPGTSVNPLAFGLPIPPVFLSGTDPKGGVWGGHFGYNWQMGAFVGGIEADISSTQIKGSAASTVATATDVFGDTITHFATRTDKFDLLGSTRGRVGWLAWPNVLLYGTGGLGWTRFVDELSETVTISTPGEGSTTATVTTSNPVTKFGWVAGAGIEGAVYYGWLLRVEYLHYDFGDQGSFSASASSTLVTPAVAVSASQTTSHLTADVVRAGLSYKF